MKKSYYYLFVILALIIVYACSDFERVSMFDPDTDSVKPLKTLNLEIISLDSIKISWDDDYMNESGYTFNIDKKPGADSVWTENFMVLNEKVNTYYDTIPTLSDSMYYRIRVCFDKNKSVPLEKSVFFNFNPPSNLTINQNNVSTFTLNWTDNSNGEDGFKVERKIDDGAYSVIATVTGTSYVDDTVSKGFGTVYYQVRAYKDTFFSSYATVNTSVLFPAPSNLNAVQTTITSATLSWSDNSVGEEKFEIERKLSTETSYVKVTEVTGSDTATKNWIDSSTVPNLTYDYRVRAVKGINNSSYSSKTFINTFPAPTDLNSTQSSITSATLSWNDNSIGEDRFEIERKLSTETTYVKVVEVTGSDTATKSWLDTNTIPNLTYDYRVRAIKGTFNSGYISDILVNTFPAPTNFSFSRDSLTTLTLIWTDNSIGEDKFDIERKLSTETTYMKIAEVAGSDTNTKSWIDTNLLLNMNYNYRIRAQFITNYSDFAYNNYFLPIVFSKTFGGTDYDFGASVQQTSDGGYIITGASNSFGTGNFDLWLIKTDSDGNETWSKTFGGIQDDNGRSVQQTTDGGYIVTGETFSFGSGYSRDLWLIKTDSNGNETWSKTFGGLDSDGGYSVQHTTDGGYIITGHTYSFGAGQSDCWLIKTDSNGNEIWSKTFGGIQDDNGRSVQQTSDGGYIITGHTYSFGAGQFDCWLIKTDANGNETWSKTFGGIQDDIGYSVQQTSDDGYIITGNSDSFGGLWLIKTDSEGYETWSNTLEGSTGTSVQQTTDGGFIITGNNYNTLMLIKTDTYGKETWSKTFGGSEFDIGFSVQQTSDGGYIVTGETSLFGSGYRDLWLIKTDYKGDVFGK